MNNISDISLVDAHSKCNRSDDLSPEKAMVSKVSALLNFKKMQYRDILLLHEPILNLHSLLGGHPGVIGQRPKPTFSQLRGNIFGLLETVHNACQ